MGGRGHIDVKLANALGGGCHRSQPGALEKSDGLWLDAKEYYATSDAETFITLAGRFDLIIHTVSVAINWNLYLNLLKVNGIMVVVGAPEHMVPVHAFSLIPGRKSLAGSMIGSIKETQEMLDFCGKHNIVSETETINIQDINDAYERVLKSNVRYRFVIDMSSLTA